MRFHVFQLLIVLFLFSCTNKKQAGSDAVFADYTVTGDEASENVTCLLRFYSSQMRRDALYLESPATVTFDGTAVAADSTRFGGAYYEVQQPLAHFSGTHTIVFNNGGDKEYKETFTFQPFALATELTETVPRDAMTLQLTGLKATESIRVLLTDTSFATNDINDIETVQNGTLTISQDALRNVASGPVTLHLFKEEERRLENAPAGGGRLSITYSLSREFILADE